MFKLDSNNLFEVNIAYEKFLEINNEATKEHKRIVRALLLTQSFEKVRFLTEENTENILRAYNMINSMFSDLEMTKNKELATAINSGGKRREQINRSDALRYVIDKLNDNNDKLKINGKSYNTLAATKDGKSIKIKIKLSNNFAEEHFRSWHKENLLSITDYDYHIYLVENRSNTNQRYRTLLFTLDEIQALISKKRMNKDNIIHYYYDWGRKEQVYDEREDTPIDVTFADADTKKLWRLG